MALKGEEIQRLVTQVREARQRHADAPSKSRERLARLTHKLRSRRTKAHRELLYRLAEEHGIDVEALEEEHRKTREALATAAREEKEKLTRAIQGNLGYRRTLRAHIARLDESHYNVKRSNPGLTVCDWFAEADSGTTLVNSNPSVVDHAVERLRGSSLGDNRIRTRIEVEGAGQFEREDWFEFIWEPEETGVASISAVFQPTGTFTAIAPGHGWGKYQAVSLSAVIGWVDVAQVTNQGLAFFPERGQVFHSVAVQDDEVEVRSMHREFTIDFHADVPLLSGSPVVVTAGYRFDLYMPAGGYSAEIDMNSASEFAATVPMVMIHLRT